MGKKFLILICTILLTCNSFGCTKVNNTQKHTEYTNIINYDKELLYKQAEALTKHIVSNSLKIKHINNNEKITFSSRDIFDFVITLFIYREDPNHPYNNISEMHIDDHAFAHYKFEDVQRVVKELYGVQNWFDPALEQFYDKNSNKIIISTEQGMPFSFYMCKNIEINSLADTNYIEEKFELIEFNPYEEEKGNIDHGVYKIIFEVINENDKNFLRINSFESVK